MARSTFLGTAENYLFETTSTGLHKNADEAKTLTFADANGNPVTVLLNGEEVSSLVVPAGELPPFVQGPDGLEILYVNAGGGAVPVGPSKGGVSSWNDLADKPTIPTTAADVGALPADTPIPATAADVGALPDSTTPGDIGALAVAETDTQVASLVNDPGSETGGALSAYARTARGRELPANAFAPLAATLAEGKVSCGLQIVTDSTGYTTGRTRWTQHFANWLVTEYPNYAVQLRTWNGTSYDSTDLSGTPTARTATFNKVASLTHPGNGTAMNGDFELIVRDFSVPAWPITDPAASTIASRWGGAAGVNGWHFFMQTSSTLRFQFTTDGTNNNAVGGSAPQSNTINLTPNTPIWLRVTRVKSTGDVTFYTSTDKGVTWTPQGTGAGRAPGVAMFDPGDAWPYQVSGWGDTNGWSNITVGGVSVSNSIGGQSVVPRYLDAWTTRNPSSAAITAATFAGKPVLTVINGSSPGNDIAYFTSNVTAMNPYDFNTLTLITGTSHNDGFRQGRPYRVELDNYLTALRNRNPEPEVVWVTQNPKTPGVAARVEVHARRRRDQVAWAVRNRLTLVDVYGAFINSATPLSTLNDTDGIHPTDGAADDSTKGSPLWFQTVRDAFQGKTV